MSFLQRIWKATETDRGILADLGRERKAHAAHSMREWRGIFMGLSVIVLPILIVAVLGYAIVSGVLIPLAKGILRVFG
ncbi:hypothetical protein ACOTET_23035 [Achromobacter xylosoxidans]